MLETIINTIFYICVIILEFLGTVTGLGYRGINVLIFCILGPAAFIILLYKYLRLKALIKR